MSDILIVEDEVVLARSIVDYLERRGFTAGFAVDATSARAIFERDAPRLVILDYKLNEDDGLDVLQWINGASPRTQVVMMTGHGDVDVAVRAMKAGARDFLVKPTPLASIAAIAAELMLDEMQGGIDRTGTDRIVGRSSAANALRDTIRKLGKPSDPRPGVLIMGPPGSGKTLAGLALHEIAAPDAPVEVVECLGCDADALAAAFGRAGTGTLLLRHVCKLEAAAQARLVQEVGRASAPPTLIATATRHLMPGPDLLPELLYRIQVGWIDIPPLTERAADVLPIADYFARHTARDRGEARPRFTAAARAKLLGHDWPGNVAELRNCIERAILDHADGKIDAEHIRAIGASGAGRLPTLRDMERGAITKALSRTRGNVSRAAELLGISRDTLRYRMAKFELPRK